MFSSDEIQFSVKKSIKDKNLSHNKLVNEGFVVYISDKKKYQEFINRLQIANYNLSCSPKTVNEKKITDFLNDIIKDNYINCNLKLIFSTSLNKVYIKYNAKLTPRLNILADMFKSNIYTALQQTIMK